MGRRIIELNENTSFNDDDYMVLDNSTDTAKFTFANLWNTILSKIQSYVFELDDGDLTLVTAINNISSRLADVESALPTKANSSTTLSGYGITNAYTKSEMDTSLNLKADKSTTYTKTEIDEMLAPIQAAIAVIQSYSNADETEY